MSDSNLLLAEREIEILRHVADGLSNGDIAEATGLSLYTVKWYLKQIFGKLYVVNRTQAAAKARSLGLLRDAKRATATMQAVPAMPAPIVGRDAELSRLHALLESPGVRLVTVHGVGGIGKTRLVNEAAFRAHLIFPDGVVYVPLATHNPSDSLLAAIAQAVRLPVTDPSTLLYALRAYLRPKHILLVLDNFEHMTAQAVHLSDLLALTDRLKLLVTSREILHLQGEVLLRLDGLPVPAKAAESHSGDAYDLFVRRVRAVQPEYAPAADEHAEIVALCRLTKGMPLALELAAGWAGVLSVQETRRRIMSSLDVLTSRDRDRPARHRSMRSVFDASWDMLSAAERRALVMLSIVRDSFTAEAADAVAGASADSLRHLLDKSLLQRTADGRFEFHTLLHQYLEQLRVEQPDIDREARLNFTAYYLGFARERCEALCRTPDLTLLPPIHAEYEPILKAWGCALDDGRYALLEGAAGLGYYFDLATRWREGADLFAAALDRVPADQTVLRGRLYAFRTSLANQLTDVPTLMASAPQAWALLQGTPYEIEGANALACSASMQMYSGSDEESIDQIFSTVEAALDANAGANGFVYISVNVVRGFVLLKRDIARGMALLEGLLQHWPAGATWLRDTIRAQMGELYLEIGQVEKARAMFLSALQNASASGDALSCLTGAYGLHISGPDADKAAPLAAQVIALSEQLGGAVHISLLLDTATQYMLKRGKAADAVRIIVCNALMLGHWYERDIQFELFLAASEWLAPLKADVASAFLRLVLDSPECPAHVRERAALRPGLLTVSLEGGPTLNGRLAALYTTYGRA